MLSGRTGVCACAESGTPGDAGVYFTRMLPAPERGGKALAAEASSKAQALADKEKVSEQDLLDLDEYFIENHLSPGGCADLLAVTYFLYDLTRG